MKTCTKCHTSKPQSEYYKQKNTKDFLTPACRECLKKQTNKYKLENKDVIKKRDKIYRENNIDKIKESDLIYRINNRNKINKKSREYYHETIEYQHERTKNYRNNNKGTIKYIARHQRSEIKRRALKETTDDKTINKESLLYLLVKQNNNCHYCGVSLDETKHLDHYIPLSKGGSHSISNVVWSCASCNLKKSAKMPTTLLLI